MFCCPSKNMVECYGPEINMKYDWYKGMRSSIGHNGITSNEITWSSMASCPAYPQPYVASAPFSLTTFCIELGYISLNINTSTEVDVLL